MAPKAAKVYTVEELKAKSQEALNDPNLVDIARATPSQGYDRAFYYAYEKTKDLQTAKKLAVATRWLSVIYRDYGEEFKKLVAQEKQPSTKAETRKKFSDLEFSIVDIELITRWRNGCSMHFIKFPAGIMGNALNSINTARYLCKNILNALMETRDHSADADVEHEYSILRNDLIQLLEENFGVKVKVCVNCEYFGHTPGAGCAHLSVPTPHSDCCKNWSPRKVTKKKEN